ncbi:hydroxyethylthiazole kinase [Jeotgalibaca ciconiae]|nr:hydroxyethylthiazole kinase [Jeotgalibaca ciconiae]
MVEKYMQLINQVREQSPLVHHITNYVTVNDCANITLAIGASPIMADALEEAAEITQIASGLVLNMGTLNKRTVASMIESGKMANKIGIPVILDPVGAGASSFRNETAAKLLKEIKVNVLRGNISEIKFLAGLDSETKGVDASENDWTNSTDAQKIAQDLAIRLDCIVAITGKVDFVSDGNRTVAIENGHSMLSQLTGTGCMCSSLIGSYCGAAAEKTFEATVTALVTMGVAGELSFEKAGEVGNGSFRVSLQDAISKMNEEMLTRRALFYEI